jgi:hypothetical protein
MLPPPEGTKSQEAGSFLPEMQELYSGETLAETVDDDS